MWEEYRQEPVSQSVSQSQTDRQTNKDMGKVSDGRYCLKCMSTSIQCGYLYIYIWNK